MRSKRAATVDTGGSGATPTGEPTAEPSARFRRATSPEDEAESEQLGLF